MRIVFNRLFLWNESWRGQRESKTHERQITKVETMIANEMVMFLHCKKCLKKLPADQSPRDYASIEAGWTKSGLQLWCRRHEINIIHVDFEGQRHPAVSGAWTEVH